MQSVWPCGRAELRIHDAWFDDGKPIRGIDTHDAIQSGQHEQHTSGIGKRTTRQAGASASRYEGNVVRGQQSHDGDQLLTSARQNDEIGKAAMSGKTVHRVGDTFGTGFSNVPRSNDRSEVRSQVRKRGHAIY